MSISGRSSATKLVPRALAGTQHVHARAHPAAPVTSNLIAPAPSQDRDVGVVPDHEAVRAAAAATQRRTLTLRPEQRRLPSARRGARQPSRRCRIECSTSADVISQRSPNRRVRADVAVAQARAGADDRRAAHGRALQPRARLDHDAPVDARVDQLAVDPFLSGWSRISRLASSMSSRRPVSFHHRARCAAPRATLCRGRCWIASVISSSPRGRRLDRARRGRGSGR